LPVFGSSGDLSRARSPFLAAQPQVRNELAVPFEVFFHQVSEQPATLADLHQQAAAAVVILFVNA
jgi:hypothetical protein